MSEKTQTTIYRYKVEVADGSGILSAEKTFTVTPFSVIGENDTFMAINDLAFTTIRKKKERDGSEAWPVLNRSSVSIYAADKCWGNRIWLSLYSDKPVTPAFIRRAIEKEIDRRFGYFTGKLDLSFITEKAHAA